MNRIRQVVSGALVRFVYIYLFFIVVVVSGGLLMDVYGSWRAAHPQLTITDLADSVRISWGPMYRREFPGKSLFEGGVAAQSFFQAYPVYYGGKDGSWEGIIVPETVPEYIAGRVRLLFSLRAEQPVFEIREGKSYQLVAARPTWTSGTTHRWEEKALSGDVAWALQVSRGHLNYHKRVHQNT